VLLRRHCALGDESSELGASQTYHGLGVEVSATLQADETVYLFVYTYSTARDYTVSVQGPR
jgi:hypothetical protein